MTKKLNSSEKPSQHSITDKTNRDKFINCRFTPSEAALISEAANQHKTTLSHLIRDAALILASGIVEAKTNGKVCLGGPISQQIIDGKRIAQ